MPISSICEACKQPFESTRPAKTCSTLCRKRLSRGIITPSVTELVTDYPYLPSEVYPKVTLVTSEVTHITTIVPDNPPGQGISNNQEALELLSLCIKEKGINRTIKALQGLFLAR
jgi:hypothetical protein